jgi:hypothetical protein
LTGHLGQSLGGISNSSIPGNLIPYNVNEIEFGLVLDTRLLTVNIS